MSTRVKVEYDGYSWIGEVEGGGVTQARRIDLIPARVVEVVKLMTGRAIGVDDVELDIVVPGKAAKAAEAARALRAQVSELRIELDATTRRAARALKAQGLSLRDIGSITGISHQRVAQILDEVERA